MSKNGSGARPSASASVSGKPGRGAHLDLNNPANARTANAYHASRGMPSLDHSGSGCLCHRSMTTHAASHVVPRTAITRAGLPAGAGSLDAAEFASLSAASFDRDWVATVVG